ncbi:hypothetical protein KCP70_16115 [Salmonella enterica subsp. enterica]|nr:hypothetical protein KCP70_16115 [Salmonella enterica subsp. enterica]
MALFPQIGLTSKTATTSAAFEPPPQAEAAQPAAKAEACRFRYLHRGSGRCALW